MLLIPKNTAPGANTHEFRGTIFTAEPLQSNMEITAGLFKVFEGKSWNIDRSTQSVGQGVTCES